MWKYHTNYEFAEGVRIMKLRWFEVENFRSITGATKCILEEDITILAGKNEAGKSNLLAALMAFSSGEFSDSDSPGDSSKDSRVTLGFSVTRDEIENIARTAFEFSEGDFETKLQKTQYELVCTRTNNADNSRSVAGPALKALKQLQNGELEYWTKEIEAIVRALEHGEFMNKQRTELESMKANDGSKWIHFIATLMVSLSQMGMDEETLEKTRNTLAECKEFVEFYSQNFNFPTVLWDFVPEFVLFNSFEDILPDEADVNDVRSSEIIKRFFTVVNVDPESIFSEENSRKRKTIVDRISSTLTGDFCGYYQQSEVKIQLDVDGPKLQFYIKDGELPIPFFPGQRSKGFQWFLSFYLTLKSTNSDSNTVILIDEPGLYLHPKAQQEILQILEMLAKQNKIIFSTHSPYLIDTAYLNRIRLIYRKTSGGSTIVENKIQRVSDKDTLTPIITAIGYSFGQGLSIGKKFNIVTEGISDAYYIRAFTRLFVPYSGEDLAVIGAVGASQVPNIVSILLGWGVTCVAVFDNDREGRTNHAKLIKKLGFTDGTDALFVSQNRDECIEDLLSVDDFYQYVLEETKPSVENIKNSQVVGQRKVVLAKKFLELITSDVGIELSLESQGNVLKLLQTIGIVVPEESVTTSE